MQVQEKKPVEVCSGHTVQQAGYYKYDGHVIDGSENCIVTKRAQAGIYFDKGSSAPDLGSCQHAIKWRLVQ